MVTHARFFRQTAFLKIFPPVAACRFKSPGRSRRFSNAPNTACTSLRRAPPIATASNIFFPFFIPAFFLIFFSPPLSFFFPLSLFFYSTPFFPHVPLVSRGNLNFPGKNSRANIFFHGWKEDDGIPFREARGPLLSPINRLMFLFLPLEEGRVFLGETRIRQEKCIIVDSRILYPIKPD